ncbi:MAG: ABC transporter ATP-binding protein [Acidobacteria bacterium]|nr:ABC transporter ATP-binding protein [Acidobacteriota bacterium]MBS1865487.1 ABC transporter ATP-binding protein [Acidobacteriota bacterium]
MASAVIRGEALGKRYRRGLVSTSGLLRDSLGRILKSPLRSLQRQKQETFWALKDVSLEVKEGEVLGLIGRNGAGKTTLLKILSRITQPTTGWAEIHGRVGSLLEVGTGFHPELTGRENTFLSGAILGMSKSEISRKFDEIVAFAELEKFIDTPVKHYSSGMYVRLAFAVAAHLEPEILLVDEVLAVGDIRFQKKCLGKMGDVARAGRTVVLVTHQMNQIRRLCHRTLWVHDGKIQQQGDTGIVVSSYEQSMRSLAESLPTQLKRKSWKAQFVSWNIADPSGRQTHILSSVGRTTLKFYLDVNEPISHIVHGITLYDAERRIIWGWAAYDLAFVPGRHELEYEFPMLPIKAGAYTWMVSLWSGSQQLDMSDMAPDMLVTAESYQHPRDEWSGVLNVPSSFNVRQISGLHPDDK